MAAATNASQSRVPPSVDKVADRVSISFGLQILRPSIHPSSRPLYQAQSIPKDRIRFLFRFFLKCFYWLIGFVFLLLSFIWILILLFHSFLQFTSYYYYFVWILIFIRFSQWSLFIDWVIQSLDQRGRIQLEACALAQRPVWRHPKANELERKKENISFCCCC